MIYSIYIYSIYILYIYHIYTILYYSAVEFYRLWERHFIPCEKRSMKKSIAINRYFYRDACKDENRAIWNAKSGIDRALAGPERSEYPWKSNQKLELKLNDGRQERPSDIEIRFPLRVSNRWDTPLILWFTTRYICFCVISMQTFFSVLFMIWNFYELWV